MSNVIGFPEKDDGTGYILTERKVTGVYVNNILALVDNGNVYLGTKGEDGVDDALLTSMDDINRFCLMWLAINDPDVIKE